MIWELIIGPKESLLQLVRKLHTVLRERVLLMREERISLSLIFHLIIASTFVSSLFLIGSHYVI